MAAAALESGYLRGRNSLFGPTRRPTPHGGKQVVLNLVIQTAVHQPDEPVPVYVPRGEHLLAQESACFTNGAMCQACLALVVEPAHAVLNGFVPPSQLGGKSLHTAAHNHLMTISSRQPAECFMAHTPTDTADGHLGFVELGSVSLFRSARNSLARGASPT